MNLVEAWGSGIPKLMQAMKEYGLREPEFIDTEVAFRINSLQPDVCEWDSVKKGAPKISILTLGTPNFSLPLASFRYQKKLKFICIPGIITGICVGIFDENQPGINPFQTFLLFLLL